ncbi:hypothetical protein JCM33374_g1432 [Metschnikowia sp. JCM 33374]|nr:hypothetical protein JCM33374_g1432 [Metschnikowia sp. JCM 33374]
MDNENEIENDLLGLDQPLKLGRVSRIAKLTDELLFENNRGLPQVRKNYTKLSRAIRKNDHACVSKIQKNNLSKSSAQQLKVATETENLQKVLSFYQLWCHGLFPRANFKDCLKMLRGHKSSALKEYRRGLIDNEIRRLKIEKGIIVDEPENENLGPGEDRILENNDDDDDLYAPATANTGLVTSRSGSPPTETNAGVESDEDDWGILSNNRPRRTNGLFIGDDDDGDDGEEHDENEHDEGQGVVQNLSESTASAAVKDTAPTQNTQNTHLDKNLAKDLEGLDDFDDFDDFDENDFDSFTQPPSTAQHAEQEDHDEELAIMREMGM